MKSYSRSSSGESPVTTEMGLQWLIASEGHDMAVSSKMEGHHQARGFTSQGDSEVVSPVKQRTSSGTVCVLIPNLSPRVPERSSGTTDVMQDQEAGFGMGSIPHLSATLAEVARGVVESGPVAGAEDGYSFLPHAMKLRSPVISLGRELHGDHAKTPKDCWERGDGGWANRMPAREPKKKTSKGQAVEKIVRSIVERYPVGNPGVVVFTGPESNSLIDEICARVAASLSERKIGRALLIDADIKSQALTIASGVAGQAGVADVIAHGVAWKSAVFSGSTPGLDFMGAGSRQELLEQATPLLRQLVVGLKKEYQFICVSAGKSSELSAQFWNDVGDGTYLMVSLKNSNQSRAKAAVSALRVSGGRLLGCVVTDVD